VSNYTKSTNFATKDNLSSGDPLKIVKGTEIDTEFNNIATAVATKTDNASAAITGGTIAGITDLAVADGGTGASTASDARTNLSAAKSGANSDITSLSGLTTALSVAQGGTGATSITSGALIKGAGTGAFAAASASDIVGQIGATAVQNATSAANGGVTSVNAKTGAVQTVTTLGTVNTSSSVTEKAFTGIPSWVTKVTMTLVGVTSSSTDSLVQVGSGSYTTSGYISTGQAVYSSSGATQSSTAGFTIYTFSAYVISGQITLVKQTGNVWTCTHLLTYDTTGLSIGAGSISLGGALDRIRLTSASGSTTLSGNVNIMYE